MRFQLRIARVYGELLFQYQYGQEPDEIQKHKVLINYKTVICNKIFIRIMKPTGIRYAKKHGYKFLPCGFHHTIKFKIII